jgi:WD40 repeat protein
MFPRIAMLVAALAVGPGEGTAPSELVLPTPAGGVGPRAEFRVALGAIAPVTALAFDPSGSRIYAAQGGAVRVWDLKTASGRETLAHPALRGEVRAMALSADGARLAVAAGRPATVVVFSTNAGGSPVMREDAGSEITAMAWSADGAWLATGAIDGSCRVAKAADLEGVALPDAPGHAGGVLDVAFGPDGEYLATVGGDGAIRLREVGSWKALPPIGQGSPAAALVFSPDGGTLTVASGRPREGTRLTIRTREAPATKAFAKKADATATAPAGPFASVARTVETGGGMPLDLAYNAPLRRLYAAGGLPVVRVLGADGGQPAGALVGHAAAVFAVATSDPAARVATGGADGLVMLWDANTGARLATLIAPTGAGDDWAILTDRGAACGPGVGRVRRDGSNGGPTVADDAAVRAALAATSRPPVPDGNARSKGSGARKKGARP